MTKVVQTFQLDKDNVIVTPIQSEFLKAVESEGKLEFYFLVKANQIPKAMKEKHTFMLEATGTAFKHEGRCDYIETFPLSEGSLVLHLFKLREVEATIEATL